MAPETIIGQLRPTYTDVYIADKMAEKKDPKSGKMKKGCSFAAAWEGLFGSLEYTAVMEERTDATITIDFEDGTHQESIAKDIYDFMFSDECNWVISANGTIFTLEKAGIIPGLLKRWYSERQEMQRNKQFHVELDSGIQLPDDLLDIENLL
jgi:hypothetical protein